MTFEPKDHYELVHRIRQLREKGKAAALALAEKVSAAKGHDAADGAPAGAAEAPVVNAYKSWPASLTKYLTKELSTEYTFHYYVLDEREFDNYREKAADYSPLPISGDKEKGGATVIKSLLKVDFLRAQRHLDDPDEGASSLSEWS